MILTFISSQQKMIDHFDEPPAIPPRLPRNANNPPARPYKPQKYRAKSINKPIKLSEQNPLLENMLKTQLLCEKIELDYRDTEVPTTLNRSNSSSIPSKTIKIACSSCQNPITIKIMDNDTVVLVNCRKDEEEIKSSKQKNAFLKKFLRCFFN